MNDDTGFQTAYTVSGTDLVLRRPPCFDLAATLDCGQAFRFHSLPDGSWQGVVFGRVLRLSARTNGDIVLHQVDEREFHRRLKLYFTLDLDYPRLLRRLETDPALRRAVKAVPGLRLLRQELWETVCSFIISQQQYPADQGDHPAAVRGFWRSAGGGGIYLSAAGAHRGAGGTAAFMYPGGLSRNIYSRCGA